MGGMYMYALIVCVRGGGTDSVVKAACLESQRSSSNPTLGVKIHRNKIFVARSASDRHGSIRILRLEGSLISFISRPSLAYMCTKVA